MAGGMRVEAIVWHDAAKADRKRLTDEPMILVTIGAVINETKSTVYLAYEVENTSKFKEEDMDYTEIPKRVIKSRTVIGDISVPIGRKRKPKGGVTHGTKSGSDSATAGPEGPTTVLARDAVAAGGDGDRAPDSRSL